MQSSVPHFLQQKWILKIEKLHASHICLLIERLKKASVSANNE